MSDFFFHCPKCNTEYCCDDEEKGSRLQCPNCQHVFIPADLEKKICPSCGEKNLSAAAQCRFCGKHFNGERHFRPFGKFREPRFRKNFFGFLLLCALIAAGIFGWKKYSDYKTAREKARQEMILRQKREAEEKRRAQEAERRKLEEEREAEERRIREIERQKRDQEAARKRREEAAARQKREQEERERREAERQKREAEQKKLRDEQEAERRRREEEEKRRRAEEEKRRAEEAREAARKNETRLRRARNHLQTLLGQLKIKKGDLERALKREKNSHKICLRKMGNGSHKKHPCVCCNRDPETFTWEFYNDTRSACCKAYIAAVIQRRKIEEDISKLENEINVTESQIKNLETGI